MDKKPYVIGNLVEWVREGDTLDSTNPASRTEAPAASDSAWIDLGIVDQVSVNPQINFREVHAPSPGGQKVLEDKIPISKMLDINFTLEELSPEIIEYIFDTDASLDNTSTTYAILGSKDNRGWLRFKQYDQNDVLFNTVLVYVSLTIDGAIDFVEETKPGFVATVLKSTLNTGTLVAT